MSSSCGGAAAVSSKGKMELGYLEESRWFTLGLRLLLGEAVAGLLLSGKAGALSVLPDSLLLAKLLAVLCPSLPLPLVVEESCARALRSP